MRYFLGVFFLVLFFSACDPIGNNNPAPDEFESFFDPTKIHELKLEVTLDEWISLTNDLQQSSAPGYYVMKYHTEIMRQADFYNETEGHRFENVGFRVRGNTTRALPVDSDGKWWPVHWRISFSEEFEGCESVYGSDEIETVLKQSKEIYGVRSLVLKFAFKDPSHSVEALSFDLMNDAGVPAPRFTFANLSIEILGLTNINYGTYYVFEPIDKEFVQRRWGTNAYLFKCLYQNGPADLNLNPTLYWDGTERIGMEKTDPANLSEALAWDPAGDPYKPAYDLKTMKTDFSEAKTALETLIYGINNNEGSDFENFVKNNIDVDGFLKMLALDALIGTKDDYWGCCNNYYLVLCPTNQKWTFIPYDYDQTFTNNVHGTDDEMNASATNWGREAGWNSGNSAILVDKMFAIEEFENQYRSYLLEFSDPVSGIYTWENISSKMNGYQSVVSTFATADDIVFQNPATNYSGDISDRAPGFHPNDYNPVVQQFVITRLSIVSNELR